MAKTQTLTMEQFESVRLEGHNRTGLRRWLVDLPERQPTAVPTELYEGRKSRPSALVGAAAQSILGRFRIRTINGNIYVCRYPEGDA